MSVLSSLTIGSLTLTPTFDSAVKSYTATTTNASDAVTATVATGGSVTITVNDSDIDSGDDAEWLDGINEVSIDVSYPAKTANTYKVRVTKTT